MERTHFHQQPSANSYSNSLTVNTLGVQQGRMRLQGGKLLFALIIKCGWVAWT